MSNNELQTVAEIESFHEFLLLSYLSHISHQIYAIFLSSFIRDIVSSSNLMVPIYFSIENLESIQPTFFICTVQPKKCRL